MTTRPATRSGWLSASHSSVWAPIEAPASTARSTPVASRTAIQVPARAPRSRSAPEPVPASRRRGRGRRRRSPGVPSARAPSSPSPRSGGSRSVRAAGRPGGPRPPSCPARRDAVMLDASARSWLLVYRIAAGPATVATINDDMDVTETRLPDRGPRPLPHRPRGRRFLGRMVRSVPPARPVHRARRGRPSGQGRAGQGRRRRQPEPGPDVRDPEHPGRQGVQGRPRGRGVRRRPAAGGGRSVPGFAPALRGRRAGGRRATRSRCAAPSSSSPPAPMPPFPLARILLRPRRARWGAWLCCARCPGASPPTASRPGSGSRMTGQAELEDAFRALDAGDHARALELLIGALASCQRCP